jgi:hypothetical protein
VVNGFLDVGIDGNQRSHIFLPSGLCWPGVLLDVLDFRFRHQQSRQRLF